MFQQSRRIVRSIGDDDEDFDDDDLESLRLAALRSMGSKVRKILMKLHFVLDCTSLLNSKLPVASHFVQYVNHITCYTICVVCNALCKAQESMKWQFGNNEGLILHEKTNLFHTAVCHG